MASISILLRQLQAKAMHGAGLLKPKPGSWRILMYHRVTTPEEVPYAIEPGMYVTPHSFKMHLRYLKAHFEVTSVDSLVSRVIAGEQFTRPVAAITFDDGWADNYKFAFPQLIESALPATVFLATDYIGTGKFFWSAAFQSYVSAGLDVKPIREILLSNSLGSEASLLQSIPTDACAKRELISRVILAIKSSAKDMRNRIISELRPLLAQSEGQIPKQFLTWEEAAEMGQGGIVFGSHTHSHAPLTDLSEREILKEIETSLVLIRKHQLPESRVFCYPGGYANELTQRALSRFNFTAALLTSNTLPNSSPPTFTRTGVHEDMSSTEALFAKRIN